MFPDAAALAGGQNGKRERVCVIFLRPVVPNAVIF